MLLKPYFYPYNRGSVSCRNLVKALNTKRLRPDGTYKYKPHHLIINWGNSHLPKWWKRDVIKVMNFPECVAMATHKLACLQTLHAAKVRVPEYTAAIDTAKAWFGGNPKTVVVCRTIMKGHSGRGIIIAEKPEDLVRAGLYTKHVRHKQEFRIHVVRGKVIDAVEKRKSYEGVKDTFVRSHKHGYIFCRENVVIPKDVTHQALEAVAALKLNFGAVDIAYRVKEGQAYVLEVNTAPGIEGQTILNYVKAFKDAL